MFSLLFFSPPRHSKGIWEGNLFFRCSLLPLRRVAPVGSATPRHAFGTLAPARHAPTLGVALLLRRALLTATTRLRASTSVSRLARLARRLLLRPALTTLTSHAAFGWIAPVLRLGASSDAAVSFRRAHALLPAGLALAGGRRASAFLSSAARENSARH